MDAQKIMGFVYGCAEDHGFYRVQLQLSVGEVLDDEQAVDPGVHREVHDAHLAALVKPAVDDARGEFRQPILSPFQECLPLLTCKF